MSLTEGKHQKFEVKIDDSGDFKITENASIKKQKMPIEQKKSVAIFTKKPTTKNKTFKPRMSKEKVRKIRKNVSIQRIAEYVRSVDPDDGTVDERSFFIFIGWQLRKKYPEKYLEILKKKGIMIPCDKGRLQFTRKW